MPRLAPLVVLGVIAAFAARAINTQAKWALPVAALQIVAIIAGGIAIFQPHGAIENSAQKATKILNAMPAVTDANSTDYRASLPVPIGMPSLAGPFAAAGGLTFYAGTQDYYLRAFVNATGQELCKSRLPVGARATPMSYLSPESGRQFVVVSAGGARMTPDRGDYVVAYALPKP